MYKRQRLGVVQLIQDVANAFGDLINLVVQDRQVGHVLLGADGCVQHWAAAGHDIHVHAGGLERHDDIGEQDRGVDVMAVPQLISLARRVCRIIDSNMLFAWVYNIAAIALAVAGVLPPMGATLVMLGCTLIIEARSARARRFPL